MSEARQLIIRDEAAGELAHSFEWYEQRQKGLGVDPRRWQWRVD